MTALDLAGDAWPGPTHPQGPAGPGPSGPAGPNGPVPSGPSEPPLPPRDDLMALADAVFETPARRDPGSQVPAFPAVATTGGPVSFRHGGREESPTPVRVAADSEGRAGLTPPGAVPSPSMPKPLGPPRFDEGEHRLVGRVRPPQPGQPSPQPGPNPPPVPHPPPPLGEGPQYDALPGLVADCLPPDLWVDMSERPGELRC